MLSKSWRRRQTVLVVLAATSVVCAIAASSASAALERLPNGQVASYVPLRTATAVSQARRFDTAFNNLDYNGGALMPSNTDTIVVWAPKGSAPFPAGYVDGVKTYFKNLQHDNGGTQNVESVARQYNDLTGAVANYAVTYGGTIVDTDPYPASQCPVIAPNTNCLVDAQIQAELQKVATAYHLKRDLEHEVFLLTPPKVQGCFTNDPSTNYGFCTAGIGDINLAGYCAYHQETLSSPMLFYSNDPYQFDASYKDQPLCTDGNSPNGVADAAMETGLSHEHNESITDPIPNDTWTNGTGPNHGQENGDQCAYNYGEPLGTVNGVPYNQVINGHKYWYQQEWSNAGHTCLQRLTLPSRLPHATFTRHRRHRHEHDVRRQQLRSVDRFLQLAVQRFRPRMHDVQQHDRDDRPDDHAHVPPAGSLFRRSGGVPGRWALAGFRGDRDHRTERVHARVHVRPRTSGPGRAGDVHRAGDGQSATGEQRPVGVR